MCSQPIGQHQDVRRHGSKRAHFFEHGPIRLSANHVGDHFALVHVQPAAARINDLQPGRAQPKSDVEVELHVPVCGWVQQVGSAPRRIPAVGRLIAACRSALQGPVVDGIGGSHRSGVGVDQPEVQMGPDELPCCPDPSTWPVVPDRPRYSNAPALDARVA